MEGGGEGSAEAEPEPAPVGEDAAEVLLGAAAAGRAAQPSRCDVRSPGSTPRHGKKPNECQRSCNGC